MFEPIVIAVIADHAGIPADEVTEDRPLGATVMGRIHGKFGGPDPIDFDSLDRIDLAMKLEETFKIEIPDDDLDLPELNTVGGLCRYIETRAHAAALKLNTKD